MTDDRDTALRRMAAALRTMRAEAKPAVYCRRLRRELDRAAERNEKEAA